MADKELSGEELEAFRRELAEIKTDMMRKELEEIKRERMRKELEEIKGERAPRQAHVPLYEPRLSPVNVLLASLLLIGAGYLACAAFPVDVAGAIDGLIGSYGLPVGSGVVVAALAVALALLGAGLTTITRR
jgi:hypothetical protein